MIERAKQRGSMTLSMVVLTVALVPTWCHAKAGPPQRLRCEYQDHPLAVEGSVPRFQWTVNDLSRGARQTAYQVWVASTAKKLTAGAPDMWDSGKVASDRSTQVAYEGFPLRSGRDYYWCVRTWDAGGVRSPWSDIACFEVGLREKADWKARWIHVPPLKRSTVGPPPGWKFGSWIWHPKQADKQTVYLRRTLILPEGAKVAEARLRCTADNAFTLFVNGEQVGKGDNWQQVYDYQIGGKARTGKNVIAVSAYNESSAAGFRATLRVQLQDGTTQWILTDPAWLASDKKQEGWQAVAFDDSNWIKSKVIGKFGCEPWGGKAVTPKKRPLRSMMMRREFNLDEGPDAIRRARVYVTGLGAYELYLNGVRVGDDLLTPGWTRFEKRIQYQTYDIAPMLKSGRNAVGAILGNGWWHGRIGGERNQPGRDSLRIIAQLVIEYADGTTQIVCSDPQWKAAISPISFDSIYDGETYDARLGRPGWDEAGFDDSAWLEVQHVDQPVANLVPQAKETLRRIQELPAVSVTEMEPGKFVFDFGQNLTGWVRLKVEGEAGTKVTIRHAEVIKDGKFYVDNLRSAKATDHYILKGDGVETWEPRFTYHGFRYAEVSGYPGTPDKDALLARMICTASPQVGRFECSNDLVNHIQHNILWGQRGNLYSVPTDCPQRDERLGWTGDAQIFCNTSCWNLEMARFYTKWMRDMFDCQGEDGAVRDWNPTHSTSPAKPAWGEACIIVPWQVYRHYGDTRIIEECWDGMVAWVDYMTRHAKDHLYERDGYGDWIAVVPSPKKPISAAYYYYDCVLMNKMASAIGRRDEAARYADLAHKIRNAFNEKFLDRSTNGYPGETQTANLLPLFFGMVPPHRVEAVAENVVKDIVERKVHLSTGFLGTGYINPVLTARGHHGLAWMLATQTTYPSWGYMVYKGATTLWELWNSDVKGPGMNSRNHFCLGAVGEWYYESLAGIAPAAPGFKKIIVCPRPVGDLRWVKASEWTLHGPVVSNWSFQEGDLTMQVSLPANTSGWIYVPTFGRKGIEIAEGDTVVVKDGQPAGRIGGATFVGMEDGFAAFRADAGQYRFVARGVGLPPSPDVELPPPPPTLSKLVDDFTGNAIDREKWEVIDLGLESTARSGIRASVVNNVLEFTGATGTNYWAGRTLMSRGAFSIGKGQKLVVQVERLGLEAKGSGARSSLWLWIDPSNYIMFSHDTEVNTWSYNLNGQTGNGKEVAKAEDHGRHTMKLVHDGDAVHVFLDGKELAKIPVTWQEEIHIALTGQARQKGDSLRVRFDSLRAELVAK